MGFICRVARGAGQINTIAMNRKSFLRSLGAGAAFAITFPCIQGCSKDNGVDSKPVPTGVDFTIDLNSPEGDGLQNNGDFILKNDVVVVKNLQGNFIAASQICSHQQTDQVRFLEDNGGIFHCFTHGSEFDQNGNPLNTITQNPLKIFNTSLNGNLLRVFE
jgi:Rieske Fe-S protein